MSSKTSFQPGVYKVTQGEFVNAAIFVIDIAEADESTPSYLTIYNPDSQESHEVSLDDWLIMVNEDGLELAGDIPDEIKDQALSGGLGFIKGL